MLVFLYTFSLICIFWVFE